MQHPTASLNPFLPGSEERRCNLPQFFSFSCIFSPATRSGVSAALTFPAPPSTALKHHEHPLPAAKEPKSGSHSPHFTKNQPILIIYFFSKYSFSPALKLSSPFSLPKTPRVCLTAQRLTYFVAFLLFNMLILFAARCWLLPPRPHRAVTLGAYRRRFWHHLS